MNNTSKGIWLPIVIGLAAIIYCIVGYANADFGNGKAPAPWLGAVIFVACIFWAASKGQGKNRDL
jgi:hypothetical protein